jgi:hypothetical protein
MNFNSRLIFVGKTQNRIRLKVQGICKHQIQNFLLILQDYGPKVNFKRKKLKVADFTGLPEYSKYIYEKMRKMDILSDFTPVELCNLEYSSERGSSIIKIKPQ